MSVDAAHIARARVAVSDVVRPTPVLPSKTLSERCGGSVALKAENLQRTGSFKLRGALNKLASLGAGCDRGVVAGSAGNHAWALADAARARGVPCEVFMPTQAPLAKVEGCLALGAVVRLVGDSLDECFAAATARAREGGLAFVHPFDDPDVVAGQGTIGLELLDDVADLAKVVVPLGGGGLSSGIAIAVKSARPDVEVVGVQAGACAPFAASLRLGEPVGVPSALTIADGIAVKRPGALTLGLVARWLDDVVVVGEDEIAEAMVLLMERSKLVVEGAGAVGVAALLGGLVAPAPSGTTVVVLSGGNVDAGLLAAVARRHETQVGRRLVLFTRLPDRPGSLAHLLACVARAGANLVEVEHVREGVDLHVRETAVQLVLETRGRDHAEEVLGAIAGDGYVARVLD
ncbi:MAG: threonine dehydratase [Solirubrobacteraceae bacterium]|jgi:threonine dehydratase|nr:threonine dehydratase [Solirubrobacteraceae bacterium]